MGGSYSKQIKVYRFIIIFHTKNPIGVCFPTFSEPQIIYIYMYIYIYTLYVYIHGWLHRYTQFISPFSYLNPPLLMVNLPENPSNDRNSRGFHHIIVPYYPPYILISFIYPHIHHLIHHIIIHHIFLSYQPFYPPKIFIVYTLIHQGPLVQWLAPWHKCPRSSSLIASQADSRTLRRRDFICASIWF